MLKINEEFIEKLKKKAQSLGMKFTPKMEKALEDIRYNRPTKNAKQLLSIFEENEDVLKETLGKW